MPSLFFQFRLEPNIREQEYENVLRFSGRKKEELTAMFGPKVKITFGLLDDVDAIVLGATAGGSIATEPTDKLEPWMAFLREARKRGIPILGFNYGAHLMTLSFGGSVTRDERCKDIGSRMVRKTEDAFLDPLLKSFPSFFVVQVGHIDRIAELPPRARILLTSSDLENECWSLPGEGIYAFEPQLDLDQDSFIKRLIDYQETYAADPGELEHAILSLQPSPESPNILRSFFDNVVRNRLSSSASIGQ